MLSNFFSAHFLQASAHRMPIRWRGASSMIKFNFLTPVDYALPVQGSGIEFVFKAIVLDPSIPLLATFVFDPNTGGFVPPVGGAVVFNQTSNNLI